MVSEKVIEEANNDDDGQISLTEFQAAISRSPEFLRYSKFLKSNVKLIEYFIALSMLGFNHLDQWIAS